MDHTLRFRAYPDTATASEVVRKSSIFVMTRDEVSRTTWRHIDIHRQIRNHAVRDYYRSRRDDRPSDYDQHKRLTAWKRQWSTFAEVSAHAAQQTVSQIHTDLRTLREKRKNGRETGRLKWQGAGEFRSVAYQSEGFDVDHNTGQTSRSTLTLSKIGTIPIRTHRDAPDTDDIKRVVLKKERTGAWFACFTVEVEPPEKPSLEDIDPANCIGIDLGILSFIHTSDDLSVGRLNLDAEYDRYARAQRALDRKEHGSANWEKQRRKVANAKRCIRRKLPSEPGTRMFARVRLRTEDGEHYRRVKRVIRTEIVRETMRRILGRLLGTVVQGVLVVLVLSVLVTAAVSIGVVDVGPADDGTIDSPEPLPDWPIVWEISIDGDPGVGPGPHPDSTDEAAGVGPSRNAPRTTHLDTGRGTISSAEIEAHIHERINAIRANNDRSKLDHDGAIATIARTHSYDMAERQYFSHVDPDGKGPADRFGDLYPRECRAVGENLALVGTSRATDADEIAERIVTGWMNSAGHRENILTGRWDNHGIGVYIDEGRVYATQNFCDEW